MPRLKKEVLEQREQIAIEILRPNPNLSVPKFNEQFSKQVGVEMNAQRVYKMRTLVKKLLEEEAKKGGATTVNVQASKEGEKLTAAQRKGKKAKKAKKGRKPLTSAKRDPDGLEALDNIAIDETQLGGTADVDGVAIVKVENEIEAALLQRVFAKLRDKGMTNLGVVHTSPKYAIIEATG